MIGIVQELSVMQAGSFLPRKLQMSDHSRETELEKEVMAEFVTMFLEGKSLETVYQLLSNSSRLLALVSLQFLSTYLLIESFLGNLLKSV